MKLAILFLIAHFILAIAIIIILDKTGELAKLGQAYAENGYRPDELSPAALVFLICLLWEIMFFVWGVCSLTDLIDNRYIPKEEDKTDE